MTQPDCVTSECFSRTPTAKKKASFERGNRHYRQICSRSCMVSLCCCTQVLVVGWVNTKHWGLQPYKETLNIKYDTTPNFGKKVNWFFRYHGKFEKKKKSRSWCGVSEKWWRDWTRWDIKRLESSGSAFLLNTDCRILAQYLIHEKITKLDKGKAERALEKLV